MRLERTKLTEICAPAESGNAAAGCHQACLERRMKGRQSAYEKPVKGLTPVLLLIQQ